MKTYSAKPGEVERKWIVIDGEGLVVGRLAALIATRLRGKHKPTFTPHVDTGDHVIVVNADKVVFSGNKYNDKRYYRHTGYPGGIKERSPKMIMEGKFPERVVTKAVERMLNKSKQRARLMRNLRSLQGRRASARGTEPRSARRQIPECQEREGLIKWPTKSSRWRISVTMPWPKASSRRTRRRSTSRSSMRTVAHTPPASARMPSRASG